MNTSTPIPNLSPDAYTALYALVDRALEPREVLVTVRAELVEAGYLSQDENGYFVTMAGELRASLAAGDVEVLDPRVRELFVECECGHDRGDHMHEEPHACETCGAKCAAFRAVKIARVVSLTAHVQKAMLRGLARGPRHFAGEPEAFTFAVDVKKDPQQ